VYALYTGINMPHLLSNWPSFLDH